MKKFSHSHLATLMFMMEMSVISNVPKYTLMAISDIVDVSIGDMNVTK